MDYSLTWITSLTLEELKSKQAKSL